MGHIFFLYPLVLRGSLTLGWRGLWYVIARVIAVVIACFFLFLLFFTGHHPAAAAYFRQGRSPASRSSRRSSRSSKGTARQADGGPCGAGRGEEAARGGVVAVGGAWG